MNRTASSTLMTEGSIWKKIVTFAFPLFLGNLFQQLYNTADSLIVGNFLGSDALAAVSSSGSLIFLMVGFFNGIAMGAGVVVARYYGARQTDRLQRAIHTDVAFGIVAGILLTIIGLILAPQMLVWMGTPADVLPNSLLYFRIYFMGSLAFVLYNVFVGILQSIGDSRHPLNYLILSSIVNIVLDLLFVGVLKLGVGSAALATIISQFISALLCLRRLLRSPEEYRLVPSRIRFDPIMLKQIISNGLPAGLQNSIIALANVVVQSNINSFGKMAVAGCGAYSKVEGFGFLPITCFSLALTTFISQNLGAKQYDRAKRGARFGILCSITLAEIVGICVYFLSPYLIAAFNSDPAGRRLRNAAGAYDYTVLFPAGIFPLHRRHHAGRRQGNCTDVRHALLLVHYPCDLHHDRCPHFPCHQYNLLGLSPDMDPKLDSVFPLLPQGGLDSWV